MCARASPGEKFLNGLVKGNTAERKVVTERLSKNFRILRLRAKL